jgi:hypothetical protein
LAVVVFFNPEPFFELRQLLRDEFSFRLRAVAFPIQRRIEPTNMETRHVTPERTRGRCCGGSGGEGDLKLHSLNANSSATLRHPLSGTRTKTMLDGLVGSELVLLENLWAERAAFRPRGLSGCK